jgi:hypothetical protein
MSSQNNLGQGSSSSQSAADKALSVVGNRSGAGSNQEASKSGEKGLYREKAASGEESDNDVTAKGKGVEGTVKEDLVSFDEVAGMIKGGGLSIQEAEEYAKEARLQAENMERVLKSLKDAKVKEENREKAKTKSKGKGKKEYYSSSSSSSDSSGDEGSIAEDDRDVEIKKRRKNKKGKKKVVKIEPQDSELRFSRGDDVQKFLRDFEVAANVDGASGGDMAMQVCAFVNGKDLKEEIKELKGWGEGEWDWKLLKMEMKDRYASVREAPKYTVEDLKELALDYECNGGIDSKLEFEGFRHKFDSILVYLKKYDYIDSEDEVCNYYYRAFSDNMQKKIKEKLRSDGELKRTKDGRHRLPGWRVLKKTVYTVIQEEVELVFEELRGKKEVETKKDEELKEKVVQKDKERRGMKMEGLNKKIGGKSVDEATISELVKQFAAWSGQGISRPLAANQNSQVHGGFQNNSYAGQQNNFGPSPQNRGGTAPPFNSGTYFRNGQQGQNSTGQDFNNGPGVNNNNNSGQYRNFGMSRGRGGYGGNRGGRGGYNSNSQWNTSAGQYQGNSSNQQPPNGQYGQPLNNGPPRAEFQQNNFRDGPVMCYYCAREGHGHNRCPDKQRDINDGYVTEHNNTYILSNGAVIKWDSSRPIRSVVADYSLQVEQAKIAAKAAAGNQITPPEEITKEVVVPEKTVVTGILTKGESGGSQIQELRASCGILEDWKPPGISSRGFKTAMAGAGTKVYDVEVKRGRGKAEPVEAPKKKKVSIQKEVEEVEDEVMELDEDDSSEDIPLAQLKAGKKPTVVAPRIEKKDIVKGRFERPVERGYEGAMDNVVDKIMKTKIEAEVGELCAISPALAEHVKKQVSKRRVLIPRIIKPLRAATGGLEADGSSSEAESDVEDVLYSCPLGYLEIMLGGKKKRVKALVDSGSQINILPESVAAELGLTGVVSIKSGVRGIGGQRTELVGIGEAVEVVVGTRVQGFAHFWIAKESKCPILLGRPFLMDFRAGMEFGKAIGERLTLRDERGIWTRFTICQPDEGDWERELDLGEKRTTMVEMNLAYLHQEAQGGDTGTIPSYVEEVSGDEKSFL